MSDECHATGQPERAFAVLALSAASIWESMVEIRTVTRRLGVRRRRSVAGGGAAARRSMNTVREDESPAASHREMGG